jgi:radical SAM superfamily enzyme YgiQ (UPF0313 family)
MGRPTRCLLVYPEFTLPSFWNFRVTCELRGAKYPSPPLGLITVAALLPREWDLRLVDCNVEKLTDAHLAWADLVFTGGMLPQQVSCLRVVKRAQALGKTVVVGGPDATSSPHIFEHAEHLITGEAEVTLPRWLADFQAGKAERRYEAGTEKADMTASPQPRFDLLKFDNYLYPSIQFGRGCPFVCEFCDIIELFGRVPRLKTTEQMLAELDRIYAMGYRGHLNFVDDNFVGNKRDVKKFMPKLIEWQEAHNWPFELSTEASINIADDDELLGQMQQAGFASLFVGIESPDEETLRHMQKKQNTKRKLAESLEKIYAHGMFVNTGYIIGFDTERASVAEGMLELIEASATPVNMVGLLFALPNTQLARRLQREGRLFEHWDRMPEDLECGDQCAIGINFTSLRPRLDILRDYRQVVDQSFEPRSYFGRVERVSLMMNCAGKKLRQNLRDHIRDLTGLARLTWRMGVVSPLRGLYWKTMARVARKNPKGIRYTVALLGLYLHFGPFRDFVLEHMNKAIELEESHDGASVEALAELGQHDTHTPAEPSMA